MVQMRKMRNLIRSKGTTAACVIGPAEDSRLKEGTIYDKLWTAFEEIEQAHFAFGSFKLIVLLNRHPRHASTFSGQRITRAGEGFFFREHLLPRSFPILPGNNWGHLHRRAFHFLIDIF